MAFNNNTKAGPFKSKASSSRKQKSDISEDERPCFYRIIRNNERTIPKEFVKHISKDLSRTATLSVESGGSWPVQLILKDGGFLFMDNGWEQFLRDNSVEENMILIFRYDGNMRFHVQVFEINGVERVEAPSNRIHTESAGPSICKRPRGRPRKYPLLEGGPGHKAEVLKATEKGKNVKRESQRRNQSSGKVEEKRATSIPDQSTVKEEEEPVVENLK